MTRRFFVRCNTPLALVVATMLFLPATGCIYANVVTPLAYRSPTPSDVGGTENLGEYVEGTACSHAILGLVAWGDGGYAEAVRKASVTTGPGRVLADVRADTSNLNILSMVYNRRCTVVHARVAK